MNDQERTVTIKAVRDQELAIEATKSLIATRKELIEELVGSHSAWLEVESAKEELARSREKLNNELSSDAHYNNMLEDLGQLNDKQRDQKETLSDLLVSYFVTTSEHQIEIGAHGDAREVVVKGSLGKKGKFQTSIFSKG